MRPLSEEPVYEIRAGEQNWYGVPESELRHQNRMGLFPPGRPTEWLSITLLIAGTNLADVPNNGLSLYENGNTRIGEEGAWYLLDCVPAGTEARLVKISTDPPA